MNINNSNINTKINQIFEHNQITDLKKFMNKRQCLNTCTFYLSYIFYFIQSAGILTTTIATGYKKEEIIWIGVGLNIFASLIYAYEQNNNNISARLLKDIQLIRNGDYVDEDIMIDLDEHVKAKQKENIESSNA